jgi:hypothetical protein
MEERTNSIPISFTDTTINNLLSSLSGYGRAAKHFTQTEDFFLQFSSAYTIPHFRIHHNVAKKEPSQEYLDAIRMLLAELASLAPEVFQGLTWFFDPGEIFKPCFYKLYRIENALFLYLLRLDLSFRPYYQEIIDRGDNDVSHAVRTRCLFCEPLAIPLERVDVENGKLRGFTIKSLFSETWIGEYGRGYFVQGIWMDYDLSKFFTRLFLAPDRNLYPYYPFLCKYSTVCAMLISFSEQARLRNIPLLGRVIEFILPSLAPVQAALKDSPFSDTLPVFQSMKNEAARSFPPLWEGIEISSYLSKEGRKEYQVEDRKDDDQG